MYICYCPLRDPNWNKNIVLYCIVLYCCKQAIMDVNMSFKSVLAISVCTYDVNKHLCNEVCAE